MRYTLTLLGQRLPDVQSAMAAILLEADEIIVKPFEATRLKPTARSDKESVAAILQRCANDVVEEPESIPQLRRRERIHRFRRCRRPWQDAKLQGYTAAMLVHDSRILQVTLFGILQRNPRALDLRLLLPDVKTTADEVDSQLTPADGEATRTSR